MKSSEVWKEAIREIRLAQRANRLVLFVGAGVSANSGIPTWENLIRLIAAKIGYDNCHRCKRAQKDCPKQDCPYRYEFSQQDFIRIPDYFSDSFPEERQSEYLEFLQNALHLKEARPNPINEEIFRIMPHHIITTNFDSLLEDTGASNRGLFDVIRQDGDLLRYPNDKYIIKMHGDFEYPDSIVLREGDYLEYENTHPLISAFIRSLLINHTFVFLGYGLNDYNLNLIISWINYFRKTTHAPSSIRNYLITDKIPVSFEKRRLEHQGITVISLSDIPQELVRAAPKSITDLRGRQLYAFVKSISTPSMEEKVLTLKEILTEKYQDFDQYRKIAISDFLGAYNFREARIRWSRMEIRDGAEFENLRQLLKDSDLIRNVFSRTGIQEVMCPEQGKECEILRMAENDFVRDPLFRIELDNDYPALRRKVQNEGNLFEKLYFSRLCGYDTRELAEKAENQVIRDPAQTLLNKVRAYYGWYRHSEQRQQKEEEINAIFRSLPVQKDYSVRFLRYLFEYPSQNRNKMEGLLHKMDQALDPASNSFSWKRAMEHFELLRSYAYDYYFYLKANLIPLDLYKDSRDYLRPYIRALVSLSRRDLPAAADLEWELQNGVLYALNEIDLDLITKFGDPIRLRRAFSSYRADILPFENGISVLKKAGSLMKSIRQEKNPPVFWVSQLYLLLVISFHSNMSSYARSHLLEELVDLLQADLDENIRLTLFDPLVYSVQKILQETNSQLYRASLNRLARILTDRETVSALRRIDSSRFSHLISLLKNSYAPEQRKQLARSIQEISDGKEKTEQIERFYPVLQDPAISFHLSEIMRWMEPGQLCPMVQAGIIRLDEKQTGALIEWLKNQNDPRLLRRWLREIVRLHLRKLPLPLSVLQGWNGHLSQIDFLISPKDFDYSLVDLRDDLWQELIFSKTYQPWFVDHAGILLSEQVRSRFLHHIQSEQEEKIVYGILLPPELLEEFPHRLAEQMAESIRASASNGQRTLTRHQADTDSTHKSK